MSLFMGHTACENPGDSCSDCVTGTHLGGKLRYCERSTGNPPINGAFELQIVCLDSLASEKHTVTSRIAGTHLMRELSSKVVVARMPSVWSKRYDPQSAAFVALKFQ